MKRYPTHCRIPYCQEPARGPSPYCNTHARRKHRHGDPLQKGVTIHELKTYTRVVEDVRRRNPQNGTWDILFQRWDAALEQARAILKSYYSGRPSYRPGIDAAEHLTKLADKVPAWDCIKTALAMFVFREMRPHRFLSDEAFLFQLVRRTMRLSRTEAGRYWSHEEGRSRSVYRDVPPLVMHEVGVYLQGAFGAAGMHVAKKAQRDERRPGEERNALHAALREMD